MTYPHTATIHRKAKVGTKYTFATLASTSCFLQPLDDEKSQLYGIAFSKSFKCYLPDGTDIAEGDRMLINGDTYGVKGVSAFNYGSIAHGRATLEML